MIRFGSSFFSGMINRKGGVVVEFIYDFENGLATVFGWEKLLVLVGWPW
jgi:hypothetical protein